MESKPDTIHITASHSEEIQASHADLSITVRGSSLVSGNEALKKAKEVSALVEALTAFGLPADAIELQGVHLESSGGTLLKSSSATYRLKVRCEKLEKLAEVLDIVAAQKNAALEFITWKYPDEAAYARGLEQAIANAKSKAENVAAALGVQLLGVYGFSDNYIDGEQPTYQFAAKMMPQARGAMAAPAPSLEMDIQHRKRIEVRVDVEYRVSGFAAKAS